MLVELHIPDRSRFIDYSTFKVARINIDTNSWTSASTKKLYYPSLFFSPPLCNTRNLFSKGREDQKDGSVSTLNFD